MELAFRDKKMGLEDDFILNKIYAKINVEIHEKYKVSLTKDQVKEIIQAQIDGTKAAMIEKKRRVQWMHFGSFGIPDKNRVFYDTYLKEIEEGKTKEEAVEVGKKRLSMVVQRIMGLKFGGLTREDIEDGNKEEQVTKG